MANVLARYKRYGRWITVIGAAGESFEELAAGLRAQFTDIEDVILNEDYDEILRGPRNKNDAAADSAEP